MTKMVLRSYKAQPSLGSVGGVAIIMDFQAPPIATEVVEVTNTAAAMAALEVYKAKAAARYCGHPSRFLWRSESPSLSPTSAPTARSRD
jgi:hypothetical protein